MLNVTYVISICWVLIIYFILNKGLGKIHTSKSRACVKLEHVPRIKLASDSSETDLLVIALERSWP